MKRKKPNKKVTIITVVAVVHDIQQLFKLHLPAGTRISDFFADAETLAQELNTSKRIITNMRRAQRLSYSTLYDDGKIYYLRQEAAFILQNNLVISNNRFISKPDYCKKPLTKREIDTSNKFNAFKKKK